ncbi:hypothetical protein P8A18_29315 [Streptomyces castrisilvae]|uniref:UL36 very large tegument protein n=1 Tax=Streptomyces castrisilvae TaxID=3033811 RepID=A0ABY9HRV9_9ACTN|nr:hypothetical protein [Streptomyces sp. Mut1]WLQ37285.1 hypothetical protein P8A18_29315 [Streptomyces sp. Mut1]
MTVHQQAVSIGEFARSLRELAALLDPGRGWYGVFCRRDPEGMRACLEGAELPPWDVVDSLFADLAAVHGAAYAEQASVRAAALYADCAVAHDRRPGGREQLVERLQLMLREQAHAAHRLRTARTGGGAGTDAGAAAWARDDHERATARCAELRGRLEAVLDAVRDAATEGPEPPGGAAEAAATDAAVPAQRRPPGPTPAATSPAPPARVRGKPRGARFAGLETDGEGLVEAVPVLPAPPAASPRGARFGGAPAGVSAAPRAAPPGPAALRSARATVGALLRLRAEGRSGEAHVVLCEAAALPAERLPLLAVELHRAGLGADWATLLWEVASLPPTALAAAADALAAAGRPDDCGQLLRQGVARPAAEIADAVAALDRAGRSAQAQALLGAFVRVRSPQDAARIAESDPRHLVPQLLAAARTVSVARERDVEHALRVAGIG